MLLRSTSGLQEDSGQSVLNSTMGNKFGEAFLSLDSLFSSEGILEYFAFDIKLLHTVSAFLSFDI